MPKQHTEAAFETAIEHYLLTVAGYTKGDRDTFDPHRGLDPTVLLPFIQETQPKEWAYLHNIQGDKAEQTLLDDLAFWIVVGIAALAVTQGKATVGSPTTIEVTITTMHQATGAVLLALSVMLHLWTSRLFKQADGPIASE